MHCVVWREDVGVDDGLCWVMTVRGVSWSTPDIIMMMSCAVSLGFGCLQELSGQLLSPSDGPDAGA